MKNKGFSLVELIVVIAIMAILVGVAVPVYTSYIGKANAAKDEQLLGEINSAFMVAAVDNQIDFSKLDSNNNKIEIDENGVITFALYDVSTTDDVDLNADIAAILPGELKFNTIDAVWYNKNTRQFENNNAVAYPYGDATIYLSPSDIEALKSSGFYTWGVGNLLDKVNDATVLVKGLTGGSLFNIIYTVEHDDETGEDIVYLSDTTMGTIATMLGYDLADPDDGEKFMVELESLIEAKIEDLGEGATEADALKEIGANATVLSAATGSSFDADEFAEKLANKEALSSIKDADGNEQLAQIAMAYAMYASYKTDKGEPVNMDVNEVVALLNGDTEEAVDFREYIAGEQASTDMGGYLAAMNMINDSAKDKDAVTQLLLNGFADDNLENAITGALE